jgi:hypothetical protein
MKTFHAGRSIKKIQKNPQSFNTVISSIGQAELIIWCYPVYTSLVNYQLMKFLEIISDRGSNAAFFGKYTSQITKSMHFYDDTAYSYLLTFCDDMGMNNIPGNLGFMQGIETGAGRNKLISYGKGIRCTINNNLPYSPSYKKPTDNVPRKIPDVPPHAVPKNDDFTVKILTEKSPVASPVFKMMNIIKHFFPYKTETVFIEEFHLSGGCLGCLHCLCSGRTGTAGSPRGGKNAASVAENDACKV